MEAQNEQCTGLLSASRWFLPFCVGPQIIPHTWVNLPEPSDCATWPDSTVVDMNVITTLELGFPVFLHKRHIIQTQQLSTETCSQESESWGFPKAWVRQLMRLLVLAPPTCANALRWVNCASSFFIAELQDQVSYSTGSRFGPLWRRRLVRLEHPIGLNISRINRNRKVWFTFVLSI